VWNKTEKEWVKSPLTLQVEERNRKLTGEEDEREAARIGRLD